MDLSLFFAGTAGSVPTARRGLPATLLRRYKRFLADMRMGDGSELTVHCANPGSMLSMAVAGRRWAS